MRLLLRVEVVEVDAVLGVHVLLGASPAVHTTGQCRALLDRGAGTVEQVSVLLERCLRVHAQQLAQRPPVQPGGSGAC